VSEGEHGSHGDWDVVLEANQLFEAELAALRLREAGLEARVIDQSYRQEPLPLVRSFALVRVLVQAEHADEARRLLEESRDLPEDASNEEP
jgi:Putative prokaryotic signal transducing protein